MGIRAYGYKLTAKLSVALEDVGKRMDILKSLPDAGGIYLKSLLMLN